MKSDVYVRPLIPAVWRNGAVFLSVGAMVATIFYPVFAVQTTRNRNRSCLSNQKQIAIGFMMYVEDYDGQFPPANRWQTAITPYFFGSSSPSYSLFLCPAVKGQQESVVSSYAFNARLGAARMKSIADPSMTVLTFESAPNQGNVAGGAALLASPGRHNGCSFFAFADGHAKRIQDGNRQRFGLK